ncbi:putative GTP-binding conserved hypothetical domain-containing protein [Neospora caninum Liverpool]|uniref:GTP-binding conserved hypothetical domain-containing protein, putative n=1 Tax=Neospora caninum (strain Liverpool) TaxID=572307 RepID=F0VNM0_NEOCL|nr:putative GTP-binding conserved hypothetical domain-containing protein [Neospora caninum Liverpool]CBZ55316.1 putative GTP-binding conserved hypothetical domain-containing protein [Neospora caninum Liverpool]CEL70048.1 TPA: GTP-binding conserved hypothetical domain-containing protein, putative [Neospora caninum Liverpool]|eukprot:XP_003885344.1 putative GTP-binding conserved hypothetical domain-containing protein [Neospora caninum Liverpool]
MSPVESSACSSTPPYASFSTVSAPRDREALFSAAGLGTGPFSSLQTPFSKQAEETKIPTVDREETLHFVRLARDTPEEDPERETGDTSVRFSAGSGENELTLREERERKAAEEAEIRLGLHAKDKKMGATKPASRKTDIRIRRRFKEIMKIMKKADTAKGRLKDEFERDERIRKDPDLLTRQEEELRTLRLVDPLVRPVERRRYTVQWWPNFAREALPRVLACLHHIDLLVEVRDARLPLLTQLPIRPPAGGEKPRLIVLTHADRASETGNAQWARYFRFLYRLHAAEALHVEERNAGKHGFDVQGHPSDPRVSSGGLQLGRARRSRGDDEGEKDTGLGEAGETSDAHEPEEEEMQAESGRPRDGDEAVAEGPLAPPVPPATPVLFVNAQQGGACIVRVEKAARKIVKQWRQYRRDVEVYRHRLKRLAAHAKEKPAAGDARRERREELAEFPPRPQTQESGPTARESASATSSASLTPGNARAHMRTKRALRLLVVGMPNVGKSALCNRLLGTKRARSYNYPGVTKVLTWYRRRGAFFQTNLHRLFDCVDTPGFLPPPSSSLLRPGRRGTVIASSASASLRLSPSTESPREPEKKEPSVRMRHSASRTEFFLRDHPVWEDDEAVRLLAACNKLPQSCLFTIEEASVALLNRIFAVWAQRPAYVPLLRLSERYGVDPLARGVRGADLNGCEFLHRLAAAKHHYCTGAASERVLTDFVKGYLGRMTLEVPPPRDEVLRKFHAARAGRSRSLSRLEEEELEGERRREMARESIRRTRMRGARDRKIPSDWECLIAKKEEDCVLWKCGEGNPEDQEGMETKRADDDAKDGRVLSQRRLAFAVAEDGNPQERTEEGRCREQPGGDQDRQEAVAGKHERTAEELASARALGPVETRRGKKRDKTGAETSANIAKKTRSKQISLLLRDKEVLWTDSDAGKQKRRQERQGERASKDDEATEGFRSLVKAFSTGRGPSVNPSGRKHAADLLDERLRTQVEDKAWETGAFEGW